MCRYGEVFMKKTLIFIFFLLSIFVFTQKAEAHFLATDRNIGAMLHVDPNDEPIAGSQASFFFEFKDKEGKFTPQNCDCTFAIIENGKEIFSQPLFQNIADQNLTNASVFYTFPQRAVYTIHVIGKPLTSNAFQPFMLTWNFRVDQVANGQGSIEQNKSNFFTTHFIHAHLIHLIGGGAILLFFLIVIAYTQLQKRKTPMKGGEQRYDKEDSNNRY